MAKFTLFKSGALAALAAGLALVALPLEASAQEAQEQQQPRGWRGGGDPSSQWGGGRDARREARAAARAERQQSAPTVAAQPQGGGGERGNWRARSSAGDDSAAWQARAAARAQRQLQRQQQPAVTAETVQRDNWRARNSTGDGESFRQRRVDRVGRDWQNASPIGRPGVTADAVPQMENRTRRDEGTRDWTRNRTYTDRERNRTYRNAEQWRHRDNDGSHWSGTHDRQNVRWPDRSGWNNDRSNRWSRDWRRDNRYNWYGYRNTNRNVYRIGRYYAPYQNYTYRRLNIGFHLQPRFYGNSYWINSPWQYRLPEADGPYRWVRYYDDALLVDIYSGEVVDVIHDFFW